MYIYLHPIFKMEMTSIILYHQLVKNSGIENTINGLNFYLRTLYSSSSNTLREYTARRGLVVEDDWTG